MPSVVALLDGALVVGNAAKQRLTTHPKDTVAAFKRAMGTEKKYKLGRQNLSVVDLSAMVLSHLKDLARNETGADVSDVVISVPALFQPTATRCRSRGCFGCRSETIAID